MKTVFMVIMLMTNALALATTKAPRGLASVQPVDVRMTHARELLGAKYRSSLVDKISSVTNVRPRVLAQVKKMLPKKYADQALPISRAIIAESAKHHLDPYFVMAVISGESSFNPDAIGPVGEIGMMQIRPTTGQWIAKKAKIPWAGEESLRDPVTNIRIGTAYISYLREKFERQGQLYVAAYNMGATSVRRALNKNVRPKDYPIHVMKRYIAFYQEN